MFYYFLLPLADSFGPFRIFESITIRAAWAMITALAICYLVFPSFIRWMQRKKIEQVIRTDGPQEHLETKVGTPTMGGVCILFGITLSVLLWARLDEPLVLMALAILLGYGLIGFVDDWKIVMEQSSAGLSGRHKLLFQFGWGLIVFALGYAFGWIEPVSVVPLFNGVVLRWELIGGVMAGWAWVAFAVFVVVATSNAVNLTDGLDGLAIGPVMTSAMTFALIAYVSGHAKFAEYLNIDQVAGAGELAVVSVAVVGAGLGFLWYNSYPAQIFMGDVGSLSLGGLLGTLAVLLLPLVGGIFVLEAVSVILQVGSYKLRGKRIFAMAPIHHHFEKQGWSEPKIIVRFWIISILLALVALTALKVR